MTSPLPLPHPQRGDSCRAATCPRPSIIHGDPRPACAPLQLMAPERPCGGRTCPPDEHGLLGFRLCWEADLGSNPAAATCRETSGNCSLAASSSGNLGLLTLLPQKSGWARPGPRAQRYQPCSLRKLPSPRVGSIPCEMGPAATTPQVRHGCGQGVQKGIYTAPDTGNHTRPSSFRPGVFIEHLLYAQSSYKAQDSSSGRTGELPCALGPDS